MLEKTAPRVPTDKKYVGGSWRPSDSSSRPDAALPPALDTAHGRFEQRVNELEARFVFLAGSPETLDITKALAKTFAIALEQKTKRVQKQASRASMPKPVWDEGLAWVEKEIVPALDAIVAGEFSQSLLRRIPARCDSVKASSLATEPMKVGARTLKARFIGDAQKADAPALADAFGCLRELREFERITDYDGKRINANSESFRRKLMVVEFFTQSELPLDQRIELFSANLGVSRDRVKEYLRVISYVGARTPLRGVPEYMRGDVKAFRYFANSNPDANLLGACGRVAAEYTKFPVESDFRRLVDSYEPIPPEEARDVAFGTIGFIHRAMRAKERAMGRPNPTSAHSFAKKLLGAIIHHEHDAFANAPPEAQPELKRQQLIYDRLRVEAVYHFEEAVAGLSHVLGDYVPNLWKREKLALAELLFTPEDFAAMPVDSQRGLDDYLASLNDRAHRWMNHHSKLRERRITRMVERGLKYHFYRKAGERKPPLHSAQIEAMAANGTPHKPRIGDAAFAEAFPVLQKEIIAELERVTGHLAAGKLLYALAMDIRREHLAKYLDA